MQLRILTDFDGRVWVSAPDVVDLLHTRADAAGDDAALRSAADLLHDLTHPDQATAGAA